MKLCEKTLIIFDMDGVLLLSEKAHAAAFEKICKQYDLQCCPYKEIAGMRTDLAFKYILKRNHVENDQAEFLENLVLQKRILARKILEEDLPIAPFSVETLKKCAQTHRLALASSSSAQNVALFLEKTETENLFSSVITGADVSKGKPDPEIFLKVLETLQCQASDAVVVEDSENGIRASKAAGMLSIGVEGLHEREALLSFGAFDTIRSLNELERL